MTLNILVATRNAMHVASDFRLRNASSGRIESDHSPKLLLVTERDWSALITYCGIGSLEHRETYEWIKDWLVHDPSETPSFENTVAKIAEEGNRWHRRAPESVRGHHTFLVTGCVEGKTRIALISNYDRLHSRSGTVKSNRLEVEIARVSNRRVVVTGQSGSVDKADRRALRARAKSGWDPQGIQRHLARIVSKSANSPASHGSVSSSCYTYSLGLGNVGRGGLHGTLREQFNPVLLMWGISHDDLIQDTVGLGPNTQVTSVASVSAVGEQRVAVEACEPQVLRSAGSEAIEISEMTSLGGQNSDALGVSLNGVSAGESSRRPGDPGHACIWNQDGTVTDLGVMVGQDYAGGVLSGAEDVNENGHVVGASTIKGGHSHAFLWTPGGGMVDLGTLGGFHSRASAINAQGNIVSASWTVPGNAFGEVVEMAFLWSSSHGMINLGGLMDGWESEAEDINDGGMVVGESGPNSWPPALFRGFVWTRSTGMVDIGTLGGACSNAMAINNLDQVVGQSQDAGGVWRPTIWSKREGLRPLPLPSDAAIHDINDRGYVAFTRETSEGTRAYLGTTDGETITLPWYRGHDMWVNGISNTGWAVGKAIRGNHSHAIRWNVWMLLKDSSKHKA